MIFKRENTKDIQNPSAKQVAASLSKLSGSKRSYSSLTDSDGSFIQMAGGGFSCCVELKESNLLCRATQSKKIVPWNEVTILATTAGEFKLDPHEYFSIGQVLELFICFLESKPYPSNIKWVDIGDRL